MLLYCTVFPFINLYFNQQYSEKVQAIVIIFFWTLWCVYILLYLECSFLFLPLLSLQHLVIHALLQDYILLLPMSYTCYTARLLPSTSYWKSSILEKSKSCDGLLLNGFTARWKSLIIDTRRKSAGRRCLLQIVTAGLYTLSYKFSELRSWHAYRLISGKIDIHVTLIAWICQSVGQHFSL